MKKLFALFLSLLLIAGMAACSPAVDTPAPTTQPAATLAPAAAEAPAEAPKTVEAVEAKGVTIPPFSIEINGVVLTNENMVAYPVYSVQAFSINSSGTESTSNYVGFAISDVLAAVGISEGYTKLDAVAGDGYTVSVDGALASEPTTLLAVTKDGEQFKDGPWFAPCSSQTTGDYLKGTASIAIDAEVTITPENSGAAAEGGSEAAALPEIQDKTDKVEFQPYSFLVNGTEVTNDTLAGLKIYKITVSVVNKSGEAAESTYTGYKLADVLAACGVTEFESVTAVANDGYESPIDAAAAASDYTLVAIEKDKELGEGGTIWLAPCEATESKAYAKLVVELKTA